MNIPRGKPFYEHGDWIEILAEKSLRDQPEEIRKRFYREAVEDGYRKEYYASLNFMNERGLDWEDLTDEQRQGIREETNRYAREMHEFGKKLAAGEI